MDLRAAGIDQASPSEVKISVFRTGAEQTISTTKYEVTGRGGKGRELLQRGQFTPGDPLQ